MIKVKITATTKSEILSQQKKYFRETGLKKLDNYLSEPSLKLDHSEFLSYLKRRWEVIITGSPNKLDKISKYIPSRFSSLNSDIEDKESDLGKKVRDIFNYRSFTSRKVKWGAYRFVEKLNTTVCPYCNRSFIHVYSGQSGRTRPQLDHFYSQESYPYLALSVFNLIPCCSICNTSFKGKKVFSIDSFMNPYKEGFEDYVVFNVRFQGNKDTDFMGYATDLNVFRVSIVRNRALNVKADFLNRARNNINAFKLRQLYNYHKDHVVDLLLKAKVYDHTQIQYFLDQYPDLFQSREEVLRMVNANYTNLEDLSNRVLAKLTRDVTRQFRLGELV